VQSTYGAVAPLLDDDAAHSVEEHRQQLHTHAHNM
jgi:hypothetical protein